MQEIILFISSFGTAIISAIVGMAGGVTLLSIMTTFMSLKDIIPIHGAVQLVSNTSRCFQLKEHIKWPVFKAYLIGLPLGTTTATFYLTKFSSEELALALIVLLIWYVLFKPKKLPHLHLPTWGFGILAFVVGIFNLFVGATGPMQASFFLRDDWSKQEIVATKAVGQALGHLLKIPAFLYLGFHYEKYIFVIALMSVGVIGGTYVGVKLLHKTNDHVFRLIYKSVLFLASLRILYKLLF